MAKKTEATIQAQLGTNPNGPIIRKSVETALATTVSYYVTNNSPTYGKKAVWVDADCTDTAANIATAITAALAL